MVAELCDITYDAVYNFVKEVFPHSHIPILMSRLAGEAGTRGGLIAPFLERKGNDLAHLVYLWSDNEFHDPEVIGRIAQHPDAGFLGRLMAEKETWTCPDFGPWNREYRISTEIAAEFQGMRFPAVHSVRLE